MSRKYLRPSLIRDHLRANVIGYIALFCFAMSGTAAALDGSDTVFNDDIVNGQVKTNEISNSNGVRSADVRDDTLEDGGLAALDLAQDSVGESEIAGDAVFSPEIGTDAVRIAEIADNGVGSSEIAGSAVGTAEIATNAVAGGEIAPDAVDANEIAADAVGSGKIPTGAIDASEIDFDAVGKAELAENSVGASSIVELHEHEGTIRAVEDGTAHDGAFGVAVGTVSCFSSEKMISASVDWLQTNNHNETFLANAPEFDRSGDDTATVIGAYDGGGGVGNPATFQAVATCLGP